MAAKDSISANESTDYSTFANDLMLELHGVKSFADATRALLCEHAGYDSDKELIGAHFLLEAIMAKVDGVVNRIDGSSFLCSHEVTA